MDFIDLASKRQSVRKYLSTPVEPEKIVKCIEAARLAPSACNSQPWKAIVIEDALLKEKVAQETHNSVIKFNKFVHSAPVIIAMVMEKPNISASIGSKIKDIDYAHIDLGIATEHICLKASELNLATCILGWFNEQPIKKLLNIPMDKKIGLLIALGYPEDTLIRKKTRRPIEEVYSYNKY